MLLTRNYLIFCYKTGLQIHSLDQTNWLDVCERLQQDSDSLVSSSINPHQYFSQLKFLFYEQSPTNTVLIESVLADSYLVIPDHWTSQSKNSVELMASNHVYDIAGLALASEVSHLAPELVCYRSEQHNSNQMSVITCPIAIIEYVQELFKTQRKVKGIVLFSDFKRLTEAKLSAKVWAKKLSQLCLTSFQKKLEMREQPYQRWFILFSLIAVTQGAMFWIYQDQKSLTQQKLLAYEQKRSQALYLETENINPAYVPVTKLIQTLPAHIRFNGLTSQVNSIVIELTGETSALEVLVQSWSTDWPNLKFQLLDGSVSRHRQFMLIEELTDNHPDRTRSVQDVVIEIRVTAN